MSIISLMDIKDLKHKGLGLLKHLKCSSEKLTILSYDTLELNERYICNI